MRYKLENSKNFGTSTGKLQTKFPQIITKMKILPNAT